MPRNDDYDAILLKEEMDVRILGVVVGVEKSSPRASSRTLMQAVRRTKEKKVTKGRFSDPFEVQETGCTKREFVQFFGKNQG